MDSFKKLATAPEVLDAVKNQIQKAAETVATSTFSPASRSIFSPENLDEEVKMLVPGIDGAVMRGRLPRKPGRGQAAGWKKLTSALHTNVGVNAGGTGTDTSVFVADGGTPSATTQTYSVTTASYKLLARAVDIGVLALNASEGRDAQPNMMDERLKAKMVELILGEEEAIFGGDSSANALEFDGLGKQITTNSGNAVLVTVSGINSWNQTIYQAGGNATLFICNARQLRGLSDQLEGTGSIQRIVTTNGNQTTMTAGAGYISQIVNSVTGGLIDIRASRYVGGTAYLLSEKSPSGENWIEMEDLIPMSSIDVPVTTLSIAKYVYEATVLKVIGEPFQFEIAGLATS